jgi:hypothetical protein
MHPTAIGVLTELGSYAAGINALHLEQFTQAQSNLIQAGDYFGTYYIGTGLAGLPTSDGEYGIVSYEETHSFRID